MKHKMIKTKLLDLPFYDVVNLEQLMALTTKEFTEYTIQSTPNDCGCWNSCNCPREKMAFFGHRLETDAEYQERIQKEEAENKRRLEAQEKQEKELLAKLSKKYGEKKNS